MSAPDRSTYLHLSRRSWLALAVLLVAPWLVLVWVMTHPAARAPENNSKAAAPTVAAVPASVPSVTPAGFTRLATGPWGVLESSRIVIEPPSEFIPAAEVQPDSIQWIFRGYSEDALQKLWREAGLTAAEQQALAKPGRHEAILGAIVIKPEPDIVVALSPAARVTIYTALAQFPENPLQHSPFRLRTDVAHDWFDDSGLPPAVIELTKKLLYTRGNSVYFSDQDIVLPQLDTSAMRVRYLKTLARKSTMLVQLRVDPGTDIEPLAAYWGRGRRSKDVRPLLQSIVRRPGGGTIDLVHLLPPFPRSMLYTYPLPSDRDTDATHDCHWSTFNFFNDQPDERFSRIEFVKETLLGSYYPVVGEPTFGDVIVLLRSDGVVVHSCVYLAAGLVFTKNGSSFSVPWLVGQLDQVVSFYSVQSPIEVRRYRSK